MTNIVPPNRVNNEIDLLSSASSGAMEDTLRNLRRRFRRWNRWLTATHPYADVVSALGQGSGIDGSKIAEYVASSMPLHAADGWVFLARAFDSIKSGDMNTAVHLAYYAELRAAMSLLASEGIGVFNQRHVAIDQTFHPTVWNGPGTHPATWKILQSWADDTSRVSTLLTAVRVESRNISEWFDEAGISQAVQHFVARQWLEAWSIDLNSFSGDRDLRNHTSYRPSRIAPAPQSQVDVETDVIDPILRTWDALEPSSDRGGVMVDKALLFHALSYAFGRRGRSKSDWDAFVGRLSGAASNGLQNQLKDPTLNDFRVLKWAEDSSDPPPPQAVLSRATLLLRIASGVCTQRLSEAQISVQDLGFWWRCFGEDAGLWTSGSEPQSFADLWDEVDEAIGNMEPSSGSDYSQKSMSEINPVLGQHVVLTQFNRVPLWLLGVE